MPGKKRYNARFPPARIKKIMQTDEEIGKVAAPVPVIISRALELFLDQILTKSSQIVTARSAKTLSPAHIKSAVMKESTFDFLKDLVADIEDIPDVEETKKDSAPRNNNTVNKGTTTTKKRGRPRKQKDEDEKSEDKQDKPSHGRRDIMLPVVVNVDDDQGVKELEDTCSSDSVASLPVPIATPMASPNTLAPVMAESMAAAVATPDDSDEDYDS